MIRYIWFSFFIREFWWLTNVRCGCFIKCVYCIKYFVSNLVILFYKLLLYEFNTVNILMCLVQSWNLGFFANLIAKVFLINKGVDFSCFSCKYSNIFLSYTISFIASTSSTYSVSTVNYTGTNCLCDLQETTDDPSLIVYPEVNTLVSL